MREVFPLALEQLDERLLRAWKTPALMPRCWTILTSGRECVSEAGSAATGTDILSSQQRSPRKPSGNAPERDDRDSPPSREARRETPALQQFSNAAEILEEAIAKLRAENPNSGPIVRQHSDEPWRQYVMLLQAKLPLTLGVGDEPVALDGGPHYYRSPTSSMKTLLCSTKRSRMSAQNASRTAPSGPFGGRLMSSAFISPPWTSGKTASFTIRPSSRFSPPSGNQLRTSANGMNPAGWNS